MANEIKNLQDIINELDGYINANKGRIEALKKIEYPTKKDGSEFAIFSKNFTNCKIEDDGGINPYHRKLTYYYNDGKRAFNEDWINLYLYIDEMAKDDPRREQALPHINLLRDSYNLTVAETKQAIQDRIELYEGYIQDYEQAKEKALLTYNKISKQINELHETIESFKGDWKKPQTLYYSYEHLAEYGVKWGLKDN